MRPWNYYAWTYEAKLRKQKLKKAQSKHKKGVVLPETQKVGSLFVF